MPAPWFYPAWFVGAYLVGSLSAGDLVTRVAGVDIRALGDGNPGVHNVYREVGSRHAAAVLLLDIATGAAVTVPLYFLGAPAWARVLAVAAVLAGHLFPLFWGFRGGVGGAVGMGTAFGLLPWGALIAVPVTGAVLLLTRTAVYSVWLFFGVTLVVGGLLQRDVVGIAAVLLAILAPSVKWVFQMRIRSMADIRRALGI